MRIHLIAMGGAVMHNLALALQKNGHFITGSDDEIYNPAKDRLETAGLLPEKFGWFPEKITPDLDFAILGMHARAENPELKKALEIGMKVYSFPEFIHEHSKDKKRVVVAGSHGKTTTTSMIMHVLRNVGLSFDYLVGAQLDGFETMVQLSDAPIMVIEGDEYLSSAIDQRPKFLHYRPHVTIITGVA
ncbi:MAG: peptidoglycan synthetase, partial [Bacteroidales bacterium]|nr:peptidoglycan synthetase [Bacteroidales bacterium]